MQTSFYDFFAIEEHEEEEEEEKVENKIRIDK